MTLHEIVHDTKVHKNECVILKLDFENAYDKISWAFLFECLTMRGFDKKWCNWIKIVVTKGTLRVKLNNNLGPTLSAVKVLGKVTLYHLFYSIWQLTL